MYVFLERLFLLVYVLLFGCLIMYLGESCVVFVLMVCSLEWDVSFVIEVVIVVMLWLVFSRSIVSRLWIVDLVLELWFIFLFVLILLYVIFVVGLYMGILVVFVLKNYLVVRLVSMCSFILLIVVVWSVLVMCLCVLYVICVLVGSGVYVLCGFLDVSICGVKCFVFVRVVVDYF